MPQFTPTPTQLGGGGGSEKLTKAGESMVKGQVFLKGGELALFLFNFFKVYHSCI